MTSKAIVEQWLNTNKITPKGFLLKDLADGNNNVVCGRGDDREVGRCWQRGDLRLLLDGGDGACEAAAAEVGEHLHPIWRCGADHRDGSRAEQAGGDETARWSDGEEGHDVGEYRTL